MQVAISGADDIGKTDESHWKMQALTVEQSEEGLGTARVTKIGDKSRGVGQYKGSLGERERSKGGSNDRGQFGTPFSIV